VEGTRGETWIEMTDAELLRRWLREIEELRT